jgi:transposase
LWTREAVQQLLKNEFGVEVSVWTVGRYLKAWGLTPQKPVRRAFEQNPAEVRLWLRTEYPAIERQAKHFAAEIHWGDEMGLRSDHQVGRSDGRRGRTPVIPGTGQRFRCNLISTITNRGRLAFMVFEEGFTVKVFLQFLKRLIRHVKQPIFLIVDRHPVHRAAGVKRWLLKHEAKIRMFFLPSYSPELNPDEMLNQDVKSKRPRSKTTLEQDEADGRRPRIPAVDPASARSRDELLPRIACSLRGVKTVAYK